MDKDKFIKAIELDKEIKEYKEHKAELEKSQIKYGGGLKFTYNSHYSEVPLKKELFGSDFFKKYMQALDNKIETLEKEFEEL